MLESLKALGLEPWDVVLHLINAVILFVIVRFLVYKPLRRFMNAREERIAVSLEEAERAREQLAATQADCARLLTESEEAARERAMEITGAASESARAMEARARERACAIVKNARRETREEHERAMAGLRDEMIDLAAGMAERILLESAAGGEAQ